MIAYRLVHEQFAFDLSGEGAKRFGGRWNSKGIPALYCAEYRSLAALELAVHTALQTLQQPFQLLSISIPSRIKVLPVAKNLPAGWSAISVTPLTQQFGDALLQVNQYVGFYVPSAVMFEERNLVLNPLHPDFRHIKIRSARAFHPDPRLIPGS